jgi:hypothetical protein
MTTATKDYPNFRCAGIVKGVALYDRSYQRLPQF